MAFNQGSTLVKLAGPSQGIGIGDGEEVDLSAIKEV